MNLQGAWMDNDCGIELNHEKFDVYFIVYV